MKKVFLLLFFFSYFLVSFSAQAQTFESKASGTDDPAIAAKCIQANSYCNDNGAGWVPMLAPPFTWYRTNEQDCSEASVGIENLGLSCDFRDAPEISLDFNYCGVDTSNACKRYCFGNFDNVFFDETECFNTQIECLRRVDQIDANDQTQLSPTVCGITNSSSDRTDGENGDAMRNAISGSGISAKFTLDGFKAFQNVNRLYDDTNLPRFINTFIGFIIGITGAIVTVMIVVGGFTYVTAAAGGGKSKGKDLITNALIGLVLLLSSVALLNTVNPALLNLQALRPIQVEITREEFDESRIAGFGSEFQGGGDAQPAYCFESNTGITCRSGKSACESALAGCISIVNTQCTASGTCKEASPQQLASLILDSDNVSIVNKYKGQMTAYKNGDTSCHINSTILQLIYSLSQNNKFTITSLNRRCTNVLTGSGAASYHYANGGGHAVDFDNVNGQGQFNTTAGKTTAGKFYQEAQSYLPTGSGFGQKGCGITFNKSQGYTFFNDSCNHLHIQTVKDQ